MEGAKERNSQELNELLGDMESSEPYFKLSSERVAQLHQSKLKMMTFIQNLPPNTHPSPQNPVFNYCQKFQNLELTSDDIMRMLNQRIQKMMKNQKVKKNWGKEDIEILVWTLIHYMNVHKIESIHALEKGDWENLSEMIPGTSTNSCMFKLFNLKKIRISQKKWAVEEEKNLNKLVQSYKNQGKINWRHISEQLFLLNQDRQKNFRTAKQCKEHWASFLNQNMKKGPWHYSEDIEMLEFILKNKGKTKWASMAKKICSRTENALKNRYNLIIDKEKKNHPEESEMDLIKLHLQNLYVKYNRKQTVFTKELDQSPNKKTEVEDEIYQESESKVEINKEKEEQEEKEKNSQEVNMSMLIPFQTSRICPVIYPTYPTFIMCTFPSEKSEN